MDHRDRGERAPAERARLTRRGFWLEYASMPWMTDEAAPRSRRASLPPRIALVGFGLDSVIEFFAAARRVWQLRGENQDRANTS
jgi:hypothetical protein